jgi:hypothetical protein
MPYVPVNGRIRNGHAASIPELSLFQTTTCVSRPTGQSTGLSFSDV